MKLCVIKKICRIITLSFICLAVAYSGAIAAVAADAVIIEPDPDLQRVMGDLYAMSVAMRLYYDDTHKTRCPVQEELAHYLKQPLPDDWPAGYRTAAVGGDWWVGRKVPEFSVARKFLREKALLLGLYEQDNQNAWLGGEFAWMSAVTFDAKANPGPVPGKAVIKAAQGESGDSQHIFFNSPNTDYYWRSGLIYTTEAHIEALKKFGADAKGPFVTPPQPSRAPETFSASPVETPPDFTLSGEEEFDLRLGDVIINPIPRQRDE